MPETSQLPTYYRNPHSSIILIGNVPSTCEASAMKRLGEGVLLLAVCFTLFVGCGAPQIPNAVSDREYQVYSAWIKHHFENKTPKALFLYSRTFVFDPLAPYGCGDTLHRQDAISMDMIRNGKSCWMRRITVNGHQKNPNSKGACGR